MGGTISLVGFLTSIPQDQVPDVTLLAISKGATLHGILGGSKQQLEEAVNFVGSRDLPVPVDKTFGFNRGDIIAALRYVESGQHIGKVCINLD
jgi:D-arabinose 1-dehydrogenase-like Zn-dependent alcohol dehydrogenase